MSYVPRNEFPTNNDSARGLISINLHRNKLGENAPDKIYQIFNIHGGKTFFIGDNTEEKNE